MTGYRYLFYGLIALAAVQVVYYYPQLPDLVASHFDGRGNANGWSSREGFFGLYIVMIVLLAGIFLLLPKRPLARRRFGLRIPHRDYWLAPSRREQTHAFLRKQMLIMGVAHLLLVIVTIELAIRANLGQEIRMHGSIYWVLGLYFVFVGGWLLRIFAHFRKP